MAHPLAERPVRPITVDEALRMLDAGVFENPSRIELLLGVLTEKPVSSPIHVEVKARLRDWLVGLETRALRLEDPLVAPDGISMPEPDVAVVEPGDPRSHPTTADRKSTRLNSSHMSISYAVFCLKKKKKHISIP